MSDYERVPIDAKTRFYIFERDGFKCEYCGAENGVHGDVSLHVDHIKPVSKGGKNFLCNLITSCQRCNLGKGSKTLNSEKYRKTVTNAVFRTIWNGTDDYINNNMPTAKEKTLFDSVFVPMMAYAGEDIVFACVELTLRFADFKERIFKLGGEIVDEIHKEESDFE